VFNLGMGEITVILLLALIFLGPKKLPELASGLGKIIRDIRKATADVKNEIQLDEHIRKPFEELRDAVTLPPEELKRRDRLKKELEDAKRKAEEDLKILAAKAEEVGALESNHGHSDNPVSHHPEHDGHHPDHHDAKVVDVPPPPISSPAVVPPPFAMAGSGSGPIAGAPATGSGTAHLPSTTPPGTVPSSAGKDRLAASHASSPTSSPASSSSSPASSAALPPPPRAHRVPGAGPVASVVAAPGLTPARAPERSNVTQFLSEADLIPPDAPPSMPPPLPPQVPGSTGKAPASPGSAGKAAAHAEGADLKTQDKNQDKKDDKKDDVT
jgi:Tat protein translocase TatB subunit